MTGGARCAGAWLALAVIVGVSRGAAAQTGRPLAVCLAKEWIAVVSVHNATTLEGGSRPVDESSILTGRVQKNLRDLGAGVVAGRGNATMVLSLDLSSSEYRINSIYLRDPYPLRTVDMRLSARLFDESSKTVLANMQIPERHIAANSTDAAVGEFFSRDLTNDFASLLQTACDQLVSRPEIRHDTRVVQVQTSSRLPAADVAMLAGKAEEMADRTCKDVEQGGTSDENNLSSKIQAEAGLLRRIAGINGGIEYEQSHKEYKGLPREDLRDALKNVTSCRIEVMNMIQNLALGRAK